MLKTFWEPSLNNEKPFSINYWIEPEEKVMRKGAEIKGKSYLAIGKNTQLLPIQSLEWDSPPPPKKKIGKYFNIFSLAF